jgi:predicted house-cleaning noncanonical NTP pyrophosphatase (MazG superfamily)
MDIRSAQKIAGDAKLTNVSQTNDASLEFRLLSGAVVTALGAWQERRQEMTEELADAVIFLLGLAQMVGSDLQDVVEAKLTVNAPCIYRQPPHTAPTEDASAAAALRLNNGKLVRDKIPQIIRSKGQEPIIHRADVEEYCIRLRDKLREEVEEYLTSDNDHEELADILEVLYALAEQTGSDQHELERLRAAKAEKRGGFADRIIWFYNRHTPAAEDGSCRS